jgi:hypothetical protein
MQITVNGKTIDVDESNRLTIHVPGIDWTVEYFGHQVGTMDIVLIRQ